MDSGDDAHDVPDRSTTRHVRVFKTLLPCNFSLRFVSSPLILHPVRLFINVSVFIPSCGL